MLKPGETKIMVCDPFPQEGLQTLASAGFEVAYRPSITPTELLQTVPDYDVLVVRSRTKVTKEVIDAGGRLKLVGRPGVGLDNIDVASARARGIEVINTPDALTNAVAELVIGMMISLSRGISRGDEALKQGRWLKNELVGSELEGKVLGVIGMGRVGVRVAELAKAFHMRILGHDIVPIGEDVLRGLDARMVGLDQLLREADFVTLHVTLTPETRRMIDAKKLRLMKRTACLINTARGAVVDEEALLKALKEGVIRGAALDVYEVEPPTGSELVKLPSVVCTPHIGSQTVEAQEKAAAMLIDRIVETFSRSG